MSTPLLPRWLKSRGVIGKSHGTLAFQGLLTLLTASLHDGVPRLLDARRLSWPAYKTCRLAGLIARLDIPRRSAMGSHDDFVDAYRAKMSLTWPIDCLGSTDRSEFGRLFLLCITEFAASRSKELSRRLISGHDLAKIALLASAKTVDHSVAHPELNAASSVSAYWRTSPASWVLDACALLAGPSDRCGLLSSDFDALALLGVAEMAFNSIQTCKLCGRWSLPGSYHCTHHSLSPDVGGSAEERQSRYEHGVKVNAALRVPLERRLFIAPGQAVQQVVAHLLWPSTLSADVEKLTEMSEWTTSAPGLARLLKAQPADLRPSAIEAFLRRTWDPMQFNLRHGLHALSSAYEWAVAEEAVRAHRHRPWQKTDRRILSALEFARTHHGCSITSIASELNVDRSTISKWLHRRVFDPNVGELRRQLHRAD